MTTRRIALAVLLTLLPCVMLGSEAPTVRRIVVNDVIHPASDEFIGRALAQANAEKASAVLIELTTPGGLYDSTRSIVERIVKSPVPVIVYVTPSGSRAASAGFFILEAADIAAMTPGTNAGAAHPVLIGDKLDDVMKMKLQNDAAAFMRSIAQRRGRNVAVAESAVRDAKSFTEDEALAQGVIDAVAPNSNALLRLVHGRKVRRFDGSSLTLSLLNPTVKTMERTPKERILSWIMNPNIAFILLSLGMLALWSEFNHPGAIVPGVVGLVSILLAIFALNLLPTRYAALVLILAAFGLFALEAKFTSYGALGAGGVVCLVVGALLLVDGPIPEMRVNLMTALSVSIPIAIIAIFLMTLVLRSRHTRVTTGQEAMIGELGIARTDVAADGKVFVHGEIWNASAASPIPAGARVRVNSVSGLRVIVEQA